MSHVADLFHNHYAAELKGALASGPGAGPFTVEQFQAGERVNVRFTHDFEAALKAFRLETEGPLQQSGETPQNPEGENQIVTSERRIRRIEILRA